MASLREKFKNGIYGVAVGDALGGSVQFSAREELRNCPVEGMKDGEVYPAGTFSDDTSMTLALAESLGRLNDVNYEDIMENFVLWLGKGKFTSDGKAWDQGFVNVRRLSNADNAGAYLMAYLSDVDLNNLEGNFDKKNDKDQPKKIVKGGRLGLYPVGMQIYRTSRKGIHQPLKLKDSKENIQEKYGLSGLSPDYYRKFEIIRAQDEEPFVIETEYYSRRKAELKRALNKINRN